MKLLLKQLSNHKIDKLVINSLDQSLYQAVVQIGNEEHIVWETHEKPLITRNLMEIRGFFEELNIKEAVLRHESAYDEMIGHPVSDGTNRLEVPLDVNPYSTAKWLH